MKTRLLFVCQKDATHNIHNCPTSTNCLVTAVFKISLSAQEDYTQPFTAAQMLIGHNANGVSPW